MDEDSEIAILPKIIVITIVLDDLIIYIGHFKFIIE